MEECTSTKGVLAARAAELKGSVMAQVPAVLTYLTQHLETTFVAAVTEAQRRAQEARLPTNLSVPSTPRNSPNMFAGPVAPEPSDMGLDSFMKFGAEVESKACKALDCILQLFTWINLSEMVTPGLMDVLYSYAQLTGPDNVRDFPARFYISPGLCELRSCARVHNARVCSPAHALGGGDAIPC